jgi:DnaJ like chaperone protein
MGDSKFGKWVGGTLGWAVGGPIGALVGFSLGYLWDNATLDGNVTTGEFASKGSRATYQGDFAVSLLVLASAMMKADDRVLKSELNYVKQFLRNQFGEEKSAELLRVIRDLLQRDIAIAPVCIQIKQHMSVAQRLQLMHFLIGIANVDGEIHPSEWNLAKSISGYLGISHKDLESLSAMYQVDKDRYYRILEIEPNASDDEIKTAYRKMAKKYHPDKLGDVGEDVKNAGIEKFRQVQEAYEKLINRK